MVYYFDSDILIILSRFYKRGRNSNDKIWALVENGLKNGSITICRAVYDEILDGNDDPPPWWKFVPIRYPFPSELLSRAPIPVL